MVPFAKPVLQASMKTHNDSSLPIRTEGGERVLEFDFPGFHIGTAEYPDGPTGVTVLHFPNGAVADMDIRGGATGVIGDYGFVHAIVLAGGSLFGLEAASGVTAELLARGGFNVSWGTIPLVSGGIVYDFRPRANSIYPDKRLGRAALGSAEPGRFSLGARGAGASVAVGKGFASGQPEAAGQGAAYREIDGAKIFVCTVVNAMGVVYDRNGRIVRGNLHPDTGQRSSFLADLAGKADLASQPAPTGGNTTLTVLVTNQAVRGHELTQLGRQVHSSMARAIQPFHTSFDGDVLWTVSTGAVNLDQWSTTSLGVVAAELAWDAVLTAHP